MLSKDNEEGDIANKLEQIMTDCNIEYQGSQIHKHIHIIVSKCHSNYFHSKCFLQRLATQDFDGKEAAGSFLRLQCDGPPKSPCPHLFAVRVGK